MTAAHLRIHQLEAELVSQRAEAAKQVAAATERADAADRRVAMELERERSARAKAERAAEAWAAKADAARREAASAIDELQRKLDVAHARDLQLEAQLLTAASDLARAHAMQVDAQRAAQKQEADARAAREQVASLQQSIERLTALLAAHASSPPKPAGRRKPSVPAAS